LKATEEESEEEKEATIDGEKEDQQ